MSIYDRLASGRRGYRYVSMVLAGWPSAARWVAYWSMRSAHGVGIAVF